MRESEFNVSNDTYSSAWCNPAAAAAANSMQEHVVDESRGPYFPFNRRETYPKRLKVDFRRLPVCVRLSLFGIGCVICTQTKVVCISHVWQDYCIRVVPS